jgi:hypothetical protein
VTRTALSILLLGAVSCVPATEDPPPKGAAGVLTEPSPGSRGEPFVTMDGWTVRVEAFALNVNVYAYAQENERGGSYSGGGGEGYLVNGAAKAEVFVPALLPGPYNVNASLATPTAYEGKISGDYDNLGLPPHLERRMLTVIAGARDQWGYERGPSVVIIARAQKLDRVVVFDASIPWTSSSSSFPSSPRSGLTVEVRANAPALAHLDVSAEALFNRNGSLAFDDLAEADGNGDGRVTESELAGVPAECPSCHPPLSPREPRAATSLLDVIAMRLQSLLSIR